MLAEGRALTVRIAAALVGADPGSPPTWSDAELGALFRSHPQVQSLVAATGRARSVTDCATTVFAEPATRETEQLITHLVAAVSWLRATLGREYISVETHLWVRELTRIDRTAAGIPVFWWSDDGPRVVGEATDELDRSYPAVYCRHCGRSGWGIELAPTGTDLGSQDPNKIRADHAAGEGRFRALIHAATEAATGEEIEGLAWFDVGHGRISTHRPAEDDPALLAGQLLPVLTLVHDPDVASHDDRCPACDRLDGIRFLGSSQSRV